MIAKDFSLKDFQRKLNFAIIGMIPHNIKHNEMCYTNFKRFDDGNLGFNLENEKCKIKESEVESEAGQKLEEECKHMVGTVKAYKCDCSNETEIASTMQNILADLGPISVLINNAAILAPMTLTDTSQGLCRKLYETNVIGLVTFTQHAVEMMKKHDITEGHIININSICGHCKFHAPLIGNYCASKNAVTVLTESLKNELALLKSNIRSTSISPGLVMTEMTNPYPDKKQWPHLIPEDIVEGIVFALSVKANINVSELTIEPTGGIRGAFVNE